MKNTKDCEPAKKAPAPKNPRLSPAAADRILDKVDRLTKR